MFMRCESSYRTVYVLMCAVLLASFFTNNASGSEQTIQLGPRPAYLVNDMDEDNDAVKRLKTKLQQCQQGPFYRTDFSIGHRGAPLQFPEHTRQSYIAAAIMGAGIMECDVAFTADQQLVCRHSQCDLHTTTHILQTDLAQKCSEPFTPASNSQKASAKCCTSDITLSEFKSLCGKMDASDPKATTVDDYVDGTASWRTDLYAQCAEVLSHKESIALFQQLGVKMTPELKSPAVAMPFQSEFTQGDYTQQDYAQQLIDEYQQAGVAPDQVWPQSFNLNDILYWLEHAPEFAQQAVYLDGRYDQPSFNPQNPRSWTPSMEELAAEGLRIIAPPMWVLLSLDEQNNIVPSNYAKQAKAAGLDIITWSLERSGPLQQGGGWYYQSVAEVINNDGDMMQVLDVLAQDVGVIGIFSDWPATVTYYANCVGLK